MTSSTSAFGDPENHRRKIFSNGMWGALQQGITTLANSLIAFLLVLVVPVEDFGVYSYATALVAIAMSVMSAGLQNIAVKALVNHPNDNSSVVTAVLIIRETLALVAYILIILVSFTSGEFNTIAATLIAGAVLFARAGDAPEMWYTARMLVRVPSIIRVSSALTLFIVKLLALWLWPSIWVFLVLYVLEGFVAAAWLVARYIFDRRSPGLGKPDLATSLRLFRESFPLAISGVANQVNLRGNTIIIQALMGSASVGVFSVATRISELAYFLPVVFMNASLPVLLEIRNRHGNRHSNYRRFLQRSYDQAFWAGLAIAALAGVAGTALITSFLGPEFSAAIPVLWISLCACPFIFMAAVFSKWIIAEGVLWVSVMRHTAGAALNVVLSLLLIPSHGLTGAAIATLTSYIFASYLACWLTRSTRLPAAQMTYAIFAPARLLFKRLKNSRGPGAGREEGSE